MNKELKKAFKETIKRWEKIVDDVTYYARSDCALCEWALNESGSYLCTPCPIFKKTRRTQCHKTPWHPFMSDRTPENALRELVFLKNLYIELIDCPISSNSLDKIRKEKIEMFEKWDERLSRLYGGENRAKKKGRVDITEKLIWKTRETTDGFVYLIGYLHGKEIVQLDAGYGICLRHSADPKIGKKYKIEEREFGYFKILKREE